MQLTCLRDGIDMNCETLGAAELEDWSGHECNGGEDDKGRKASKDCE